MRLIDADALKEEFPKDEDWEYPVNTNQLVCETIDAQPTIDAVPVIRCKDCVWFDEKVPCCRLHSRAVFKKEKQFCSWAEPKEEKR